MINNYKSPDLNKPRYREKVLSLLNAETLNKFKDKNPMYSSVDDTKLKNVIKTFWYYQKYFERNRKYKLEKELPELFDKIKKI